MSPINVTLPGGLCLDEGLTRSAEFRPVTGRLEQQLREIDQSGFDPVHRVTRILAAGLASIGEKSPDDATVASLSVSDRQFLMLHL